MSVIAHIIDEVVHSGLGDAMKLAGFRKSGRNFRRTAGESLQVLNVQASSWNDCESGKFTVNLGVYFPAVAELLKQPAPKSGVSESSCHVQRRIGTFMPSDHDVWWDVDATTTQAAALLLRGAVLEYGLPWLDRVTTLEAARGEAGPYEPFRVKVALALAANRPDEARDLLRSCYPRLDEAPVELADWARQLGLIEA